jgi:U3 small nucleolar RNA-associated protein 7
MKHRLQGANKHATIHDSMFTPYEDVLGITHDNGYSSILIPGAGIANFDAFESNPFESDKQRRERVVHGLLEKLDPSTISLKVQTIGDIDTAAPEVREKEKEEMFEAEIDILRKRD